MRPKIATCCYCGTRAALVLRGAGRHELSCAACGAPLHTLKSMPLEGGEPRQANAGRPVKPAPVRRAVSCHGPNRKRPERRKPDRKRRKPLVHRMFEELWDVVEDIFD